MVNSTQLSRGSGLNCSMCKQFFFFFKVRLYIIYTWLINICPTAVQEDALSFFADFFFFSDGRRLADQLHETLMPQLSTLIEVLMNRRRD